MNRESETGHWAIWLGYLVREKRISEEENVERMAELMLWDKGGPRPEWMDRDKAPRVPMIQKP